MYISDVRISRVTKDKVGGKPRFVIYLPIVGNSLWEELWRSRRRVRLVAEIIE